MPVLDHREQIVDALAGFGGQSLKLAGRNFFAALGYSSAKQFDLVPNTATNFRDHFDPDGQLDASKALINEWKAVEFLFQLSDEDIGNHLPFSSGKYDNSIIESYVFLAIDLAGPNYTRTKLATITREVNKRFRMPAMIVFRHSDTLTLAIIDRELSKRDPEKDVLRKVTLIKDISWSDPIRAHKDILNDLALDRLHEEFGFRNFVQLHQSWSKKLDSSELNKQFYRDITDWYLWALQHKGVVYPRDVDAKSEKERSIFFIRLLTRLIFCWFLQEKALIPRKLFRWNSLGDLLKDTRLKSGNYYQAILQNLFFATLNREPEKRAFRDKKTTGRYDGNRGIYTLYRYEDLLTNRKALLGLLSQVPFINGGLFDCLDQVFKKAEERPTRRLDGFSDNPPESVTIPNQLFFGEDRADLSEDYNDQRKTDVAVHGLINILSRYKFTVEENTPLEQEIALDPELLGKVFENLLASYNEDTKTTARKKIGAFYTPRDVVQYMVDEALIAHFPAHLEPQVRVILSDQAGNPLGESGTQELIAAVESIRVLDPACGSGAFPMGVLHRLVHMLAKLDPKNRQWKEQQKKRALRDLTRAEQMEERENREIGKKNVAARLEDIDHSFNEDHHDLDFARKLYLIENSIYGVDIEPIACQIAKLRFFIALLVDQKVNLKANNFGVRPLPNLETRIVAADSLTPIEKVKDHQMFIGAEQVLSLRDRLRDVRSAHFNARTPEDKQRFREQDAAIREELSVELLHQGMPNQTARLLAGWDPYNQNTHAEFFDPEWMFSLDAKDFSGFDIVIGNPPYVRQEQIKELKPRLKQHYECFTGTADLYVYFYERGIQLLRLGGVFSFITSNKWFRAGYGEKLRGWLKRNTRIRRLVDFGDAEIFDAIAYPCIVILSKGSAGEGSDFQALSWAPAWKVGNLAKHLAGDTFPMAQHDLATEAWRPESRTSFNLFDRIRTAGTPLGQFVGKRLYRGITTGLNEAFVVDRATRDRLIGEHPSSRELLKPFLRGRDIERWYAEVGGQYLILIESSENKDHPWSGKSDAAAEKTFANSYPAVHAFMKPLRKAMIDRYDQGKYFWELRSCSYWHEFELPKIISTKVSIRPTFALETTGCYLSNTSYFFPADRGTFWLAVLNSAVAEYYAKSIFVEKQGGWYEVQPEALKKFPIPHATPEQRQLVERLAEAVLYTKGQGPSAAYFERLLNGLIYELFFESDLHAQKLTFFAHLGTAKPPQLDDIAKSERTSRLTEFYSQIADVNHPIYACLFALNGIEVVRIIEGKA